MISFKLKYVQNKARRPKGERILKTMINMPIKRISSIAAAILQRKGAGSKERRTPFFIFIGKGSMVFSSKITTF